MKAQLIANELKDKGFVTSEYNGFVFVSLKNRKVGRMEVDQAINEIGHSFNTMSIGNEVQVTVS